jgi:HNH endonuclease/AP2 domain
MANFGRYRNPLPSQDELKRMFDYDPLTGILRWRDRSEWSVQHRGKYAGTVAGTHNTKGYIEVRFDRKSYLAHRLIWKWVYGTEPPDIDHKNTENDANWLDNLRECSHAGNMQNTAGWSKKSLPKGVHLRPENGRYRSIICINRKNINLGTFDTVEAAAEAYAVAANELHGKFARIAA